MTKKPQASKDAAARAAKMADASSKLTASRHRILSQFLLCLRMARPKQAIPDPSADGPRRHH